MILSTRLHLSVATAILALTVCAAPTSAQVSKTADEVMGSGDSTVAAAPPFGRPSAWDAPALRGSLFASYVLLQALDLVSSLDATARGAREVNPVVGNLVSHPAAFVGVKAAETLSTMVLLHQLAKHHPKRAAVLAAAIDAGYVFVVGHNFRVIASR